MFAIFSFIFKVESCCFVLFKESKRASDKIQCPLCEKQSGVEPTLCGNNRMCTSHNKQKLK